MVLLQNMVAGLVLAACVLGLIRLVAGAPRRQRWDAAVRDGWQRVTRWCRRTWQAPAQRRAAAQEAQAAIDRARRRERAADVAADGNVLRPRAFNPPSNTPHKPPPDTLH